MLTLSNILQTLIRLVVVLSGFSDCLFLQFSLYLGEDICQSCHNFFLINPLSDLEITEKGYNKLFERLVSVLLHIVLQSSRVEHARNWKHFKLVLESLELMSPLWVLLKCKSIWFRWRCTTPTQFSGSKKNSLLSFSFLLLNKWDPLTFIFVNFTVSLKHRWVPLSHI